MAEFTGERLIPGEVDVDLLNEHMARYTFAARLARGKRVLDAGCGAGYGSAALAECAASVTGVDVAADAIEFARAHYQGQNVAFEQASVTQLPFPVITGGASNSLHMPAKIDPQKRKLVWEFIVLAASSQWQEKYVQLTGSPAGRVGTISAEQAKRDPHLAAITQAAEKAENLFPAQRELRENYNEFATLFSRAVMRMLSSSQPTEAILANLQKELNAAVPLP